MAADLKERKEKKMLNWKGYAVRRILLPVNAVKSHFAVILGPKMDGLGRVGGT